MTQSIQLAFLWHMHQPDYRDSEGVMKMPWVFLHAIKDYYDMPWILSQFPGLKATFNLTPSLIEQINLYKEPLKSDYFLALMGKEVSQLTSDERSWLIKICKSVNFDTMVKPLARMRELFDQKSYNDSELIDLQVLFLLAWSGNYLRGHNEVVKGMLAKGEAFSHDEKLTLIEALGSFTQEILPLYSRLQEGGQITVSTTPYFHPILPLLIDMDNVTAANPHTKPPKNPLSFSNDALMHVQRAKALYKETFGRDPSGFWPAEGAVDTKSAKIYQDEGIRWIATDEAILFRSLQNGERSQLYKPYRYENLFVAFRDHALSDLIGFEYRYKEVGHAVDHFVSSLRPLATDAHDDVVFVILDGENAWEYYDENGYPFFMKLYEVFTHLPWLHTVNMDMLLSQESRHLPTLSSGSWIGGDFSTWSGHKEKNRAWELLFQTKRDCDQEEAKLSVQQKKAIADHFLAAQCSDWFWWYGDDHFTDFAAEFDQLFRKHLITIYQLMQMQPPAELFKPIIEDKSSALYIVKPQAPIYPKIDGRPSSFFEWIGCGMIDESRLFSTMDRKRGPVEKIRYGHNESMVYVAFDGDFESVDLRKGQLDIFIEEFSRSVTVDLGNQQPHDIEISIGKNVEIALPKKLFGALNQVHLRFEINSEGSFIQALPGFGALEVELNEDYSSNWFV